MTVEITLLIAVVSFGIGFIGHWQKTKQITEDKAEEKAEMSTKLNYIDTGVRDIQLQVRNTDSRLDEFNDRVVRVEESTRSAHKRIDRMEDK